MNSATISALLSVFVSTNLHADASLANLIHVRVGQLVFREGFVGTASSWTNATSESRNSKGDVTKAGSLSSKVEASGSKSFAQALLIQLWKLNTKFNGAHKVSIGEDSPAYEYLYAKLDEATKDVLATQKPSEKK